MAETFDVIIAGLGAMGSAAAFQLASRGQKVLGLDQFTPPHALGSSHGESRIIREAYFEHPLYVPIVQRAYELWAELEKLTGQTLFRQTGGLMIGSPDSILVKGARTSAETHGLRHEILSAEEVHRRFPALHPSADMIAVWEPRAGALFPEKCIATYLAAANERGAALRYGEPLLSWSSTSTGVEIKTTRNNYTAKHLILSCGSWIRNLVPDLDVFVERQVLVWFAARDGGAFTPDHCPIYMWQPADGKFFYGFPDLGSGVKVARHHQGLRVTPETAKREVAVEEITALHDVIQPYLPALSERVLNATACLYTNTHDENFLIDWHPANANVLICSPCSGHGFKFSSAVGEIVADLVSTGRSRFDLAPFRWR